LKAKRKEQVKSQVGLIYTLGVLGVLFVAFGAINSLLLGLFGALLFAGAVAGLYHKTSISVQVGVLITVFAVATLISVFLLTIGMVQRHGCIPDCDPAKAKQLNIFEQLDHKLFHLYSFTKGNSKLVLYIK